MKLKVLIAEDSRTFHKFIGASLSDDLYEKRFVTDGEEALREYREWKPDVVLLDIMMPAVSGFSVLKEIRKEEHYSQNKTAVIMLTGMSDADSIKDCAKLGIQGYIVKPFKAPEIAQRVEEAYRVLHPDA